MRFLFGLAALALTIFSTPVAAQSEVNVNFANLFAGLKLGSGSDDGDDGDDEGDDFINQTTCQDLARQVDLPAAAEEVSHLVDVWLYQADGSTLLQPDEVHWEQIYGVYTEIPEKWSGSIRRATTMSNIDVPENGGGFRAFWFSYVWPYNYYDLVNWVLVSKAGAYDEETNQASIITVAIASMQKKDTKVVYEVVETYTSFYEVQEDGEHVKQVRFVFSQDGYAYGASYTGAI